MRWIVVILFCLICGTSFAGRITGHVEIEDRDATVAVSHIPGFIVIFTGMYDPEVLYVNVDNITAVAYEEAGLGTRTVLYLSAEGGGIRMISIDDDAIHPEKIVSAIAEARVRAAEAGG